MKRRGNRRYYQHHEVLMIRRIRELLYDQGFTISGARNKLQELVQAERDKRRVDDDGFGDSTGFEPESDEDGELNEDTGNRIIPVASASVLVGVRRELLEIRELLGLHF
jgi:DNA-binding transcriptional MerR regulator